MSKFSKIMKKVGFIAANILVPVLLFAGLFAFSDGGVVNVIADADEPFSSLSDDSITPEELQDKIQGWINIVIGLLALVAVVYIVWGGFNWMISDSEDDSKKAKQKIINAVIGLIIAASAWIVLRIVVGIIMAVTAE